MPVDLTLVCYSNLDNNAGLVGALPQCLSDLPSLTKLYVLWHTVMSCGVFLSSVIFTCRTFPRSVLPQHLFEKLRKK